MVCPNLIRSSAVFFTCATCNLQCRYCNIDKNPVLGKIDEALARSFEGDYYFQRLKEYFPDREQLHTIETWGGEPFLHMERIFPLLHQVIRHYPYFEKMYSSTNFAFPTWNEKFFSLMEQFGMYPYRKFRFQLQLSCDGPEYINDAGRGTGTTQKCLANFDTFLKTVGNRLPSNVEVTILFKQTLDMETIKMIDSKEKIIEYYKFFETAYYRKIKDLGYNNVITSPTIPNTAVPAPTTQADGKIFASFCRMAREIEDEAEEHFDFYRNIVPYCGDKCHNDCGLTYTCRDYLCGCASTTVGFLPDRIISLCNESFTQIVEEYKKLAAESVRDSSTIVFDKFLGNRSTYLSVTDEDFRKREKQVQYYSREGTKSGTACIASMIVTLALAGQVDPVYIDQAEALRAAMYIRGISYCIKDNLNITGSMTQVPVGLLRLLLNGALPYIWR